MASRAKLALARFLSSRPVGLAVGTMTRHRIRNRGIAFDTTGWEPRVEAMLAFRIYESAEIRFIRSFLRGTERAIELGGGLGVSGSHLLRVMDSAGELTSVEANGELIPFLRRTLLAHAGGRLVTVIHAAVTATQSAFLEKANDSSLSSRLVPHGIAVPALSLRAIASRASFRDYALFSDIEGAEASFIFSAGGLEGCARMVIELHDTIHDGRPVTTDDMVAELQRQGFRLLDRYGVVCAFGRLWPHWP
jgi:hypothetical protein